MSKEKIIAAVIGILLGVAGTLLKFDATVVKGELCAPAAEVIAK